VLGRLDRIGPRIGPRQKAATSLRHAAGGGGGGGSRGCCAILMRSSKQGLAPKAATTAAMVGILGVPPAQVAPHWRRTETDELDEPDGAGSTCTAEEGATCVQELTSAGLASALEQSRPPPGDAEVSALHSPTECFTESSNSSLAGDSSTSLATAPTKHAPPLVVSDVSDVSVLGAVGVVGVVGVEEAQLNAVPPMRQTRVPLMLPPAPPRVQQRTSAAKQDERAELDELDAPSAVEPDELDELDELDAPPAVEPDELDELDELDVSSAVEQSAAATPMRQTRVPLMLGASAPVRAPVRGSPPSPPASPPASTAEAEATAVPESVARLLRQPIVPQASGKRVVAGGRVESCAAARIQSRWRQAKVVAKTELLASRWHRDVDRLWKRLCLACLSSHTLCAGIIYRGAAGFTRAQTVMVLLNSFAFEHLLPMISPMISHDLT